MTIHLIHTTRHNPRPHMSEARRQHVNGPLSQLIEDRPAGEPHPIVGALLLAGVIAVCVLLVVGAGWL